MISDNGSIFTAETTHKFASNRRIDWKFNLQEAPWFGGMWERLVASVKGCLKKVLGKKRITYVELQTLINEIKLILNNRPIAADYDDDMEAILTPNHLLFGRRLESTNYDVEIPLEMSSLGNTDKKAAKRKKLIETMVNHYWQRWRKEYLSSLRESQRIPRQRFSTKITISNIVLIFDEKQRRHLWKMGRVENVIPGRDGRVRGAEVKVGKTGALIRRPINRLYPLVVNTVSAGV